MAKHAKPTLGGKLPTRGQRARTNRDKSAAQSKLGAEKAVDYGMKQGAAKHKKRKM